MTPADRIRALRLTDEEIEKAVRKSHSIHRGDFAWAGADAQFDKLLKGLVVILKEGYSGGDAEETRANIWKASRHEFGCELERILTGEPEPSHEALAPTGDEVRE